MEAKKIPIMGIHIIGKIRKQNCKNSKLDSEMKHCVVTPV
jgi:hypothetical protein